MITKLKQKLSTAFLWAKAHKVAAIIGIIVVVIVLLVVFKKDTTLDNAHTVTKQTVSQSVSLSGTVSAIDSSDLGFADGGRVEKVYVKEGDTVKRGQLLARLESGDLYAELAKAEAEARSAKIGVTGAEQNLKTVTGKQDALVKSALSTLLSSGLVAVPSSTSITATPPVILGLYNGPQGEYRINIEAKSVGSRDYELRVYELEKIEPVIILDDEPTPLGTHGLFISFPDDISEYNNTRWTISIPNTSSTSYVANANAYQEALRSRDLAIAEAEQKVSQEKAENDSSIIGIAQANVMAIQAKIARRSIYAPFSGSIGGIDLHVGESVSAGVSALHLVGSGAYQVELSVPELDIAAFAQDQKVSIIFDAFPDTPFTGTVTRISASETKTDGVSVYGVFVVIDEPTDQIRSGLTARITLETQTRENVVAVPTYFVQFGKGSPRVRVIEGKKTIVEKEVKTGLRGTNGFIEITEGINDGDIIVPFVASAYGA